MQNADPFNSMIRDVYKLLAVWTTMDNDTIIRFAKERYGVDLLATEVNQMREACGLDSENFRKLAQTIVSWTVAQELSTFGYNGRTKEKLVMAALRACEQICSRRFSTLLISEWVEDVYEELAAFAKQPIQIRVYATEKAAALRELLGCESLPKMSVMA